MECLCILLHKHVVLTGGAVGTGTLHQAVLSLPCVEPWHVASENLLQQPVLLLSERCAE